MSGQKKMLHVLYSGLGGHGNVFLSMVDADKAKQYIYAGIFMGIEPMKEEYKTKCQERNIPYYAVLKKRGLDLKAFYQVYKSIRKEKPHIVFLHGALNILPAIVYKIIGKVTGARVVVRETQANHLKTRQDWFWLYISMLAATRIIFLSEQYKNDVQKKLGFFFNKRKTSVIPNGIDLQQFSPKNGDIQNMGSFRIGMQGRLEKNKDHATLIKAFAALKDKSYYPKLSLHLAGDGSERGQLESLTAELGVSDKIKFHGMLREKELTALMQSLDIYVHASMGETMSTAIMQAMACRLPIIASDVKGINNMVSHNINGVLVQVKNVEALTEAIDQLINDEASREKKAAQAYAFAVDEFSNERMLASYIKVFEA